MGWSPELCIGEFRPWPESICVVRDKTDETRRYVPEDMLVRMELHECPACANVADLQDALTENEKLRELVRVFYNCTTSGECDECPINGGSTVHLMPDTICDTIHDRMRGLGVEVE